MKKLIAFAASCLAAVAVLAADSPTPPAFQLRPVVETASPNSEEMTISSTDPNGHVLKQVFNVEKTVLLDSAALKSATTGKGQFGNTHISVTLNDEGKKKFAEVTTQYLNKKIAVIVNGRLYCAPVIRTPITGGKLQIDGSFTEQEAKDLAARLNEVAKKR